MKSTMPWFCLMVAAHAHSVFADAGVNAYLQGDYNVAAEQLTKSSPQDPLVQYYLGRMSLYGYGQIKDNPVAIQHFQTAAEKGLLVAQQFMGRYALLEEKNPAQALYWFKKAADANDVLAQMYCAGAYLYGLGVKENPDIAKRYYIAAARNGDPIAQYTLAESFLETRQLANKKLGYLWLMKSVAQHNPAAEVMLASLYAQGIVVEKNPVEEKALLDLAVAQNYIPAFHAMGDFYQRANQVDLAQSWYMKAAAQQYAPAEMGLSGLYAMEKTPLYDQQKAFLWMLRAAQNGSSAAQVALSGMYKDGRGVTANPQLSDEWMKNSKKHTTKESPWVQVVQWLTLGQKKDFSDTPYQLKGIFRAWKNHAYLTEKRQNPAPHMVTFSQTILYQPHFVMLNPKTIPISAYYHAIRASTPPSTDDLMIDYPRYPLVLTATLPLHQESSIPLNILWPDAETPFYIMKEEPVRVVDDLPEQSPLAYVESRALLGDTSAQFELGQRYQYGIGVTQNIPLAIHYYQMGTLQHDLRAQYQLALAYLQGEGMEGSRQQGLNVMIDAAFQGNPYAQYVLAQMSEHGFVDEKSHVKVAPQIEQAMAMYQLAVSNQYGPAQYRLAEILVRTKPQDMSVAGLQARQALIKSLYAGAARDGVKSAMLPLAFYHAMETNENMRRDAFLAAKEQAEAGNPQAALLLGLMYDRGIATEADSDAALAWYQKASESPVSAFIRGTYLAQQSNPTEGQALLQKAADAGLSYAYLNLAILKQQNHQDFIPDLEKSLALGQSSAGVLLADYDVTQAHDLAQMKQAREIYQRLAMQGDPQSQLKLGYLCEQGLGGAQDFRAAGQWYQAASEQNQPVAAYMLGHLYQTGAQGSTTPDNQLAHQWYAQASAQNNTSALVADGFIAETVDDDYARAFAAYQKAANLGNPVAQYNLGLMYAEGKGITPDADQAKAWFTKAADRGYAPAKGML